ncbi:hypothetical protein CAP35_13135 [Chitinophagaceae bacterium IBVUCB1]|nr:hypothetical protein CAP35_13135 [Chitinophagaceae bacterium IBVUCB1]
MSHEPKLEIFKIRLTDKKTGSSIAFRDFFRRKLNYSSLKTPYENGEIFKLYYTDFIKQIDLGRYNTNDKKKKGFTLLSELKDGKPQTVISSPLDKNEIISGMLDGGKYGLNRTLGEIDDTTKKAVINDKQIVGDEFYFLTYAPIDSRVGIIMVQGFTELKISDVFKDHIENYFKIDKSIVAKTEIFAPNYFKEKYLKTAVFQSLKFSSEWIIKPDFEDPIPKEYELEVKIEIIDKNKKKVNYSFAKNILNVIGRSIFKPTGGIEKTLDKFRKKNGKISSNGKELPIDFDKDDNIKPVILLKNEGINVDKNGKIDFKIIDEYCRGILLKIIDELNPSNAVKPL